MPALAAAVETETVAPAPVALDALSETELLSVFDLADEFDISEAEMLAAAAHFAADC